MERETPPCLYGTPAIESTLPEAFKELSRRMVEQQMRSMLVMPEAVGLIEESVTRFWRPRVRGITSKPEVVLEGRTLFRHTYQLERSGAPTMFVLVTARKEHDDRVEQQRDLSIAQCYLWDGEKWKFLFEWNHHNDDWTFEQSPLAVVDPLDANSSNYPPDQHVL